MTETDFGTMTRVPWVSALVLVSALAPGCYHGLAGAPVGDGGEDAGSSDADEGASAGGGDSGPGDNAGVPSVASYRLMRLTRSEYDNTIRDLLGDDSRPATEFSTDEYVGPFAANVLAPPSELMLQDYLTAAEALAASAVQDLPRLTGCEVAALGTVACAESFIKRFVRRAYRRQPTDDETASLLQVFEFGRDLVDFDHGIELVVRAILQSPNFLYRVERGVEMPDAPGVLRLTSDEVASRLSYFILDSMPDDELFAAADRDELVDLPNIEAQARRLLADAGAEQMVAEFHTQWMGLGATLDKDVDEFPQFDSAMIESVRRETAMFATDVILRGDALIETLLSSPSTFVDAKVASLYGIEHPSDDPSEFVRVDLDPTRRAGLLTRIGVLAAKSGERETSAVKRGKFIRAFVLCQDIPPPPDDIPDQPPLDTSWSPRQRLEAQTSSPACNGCHSMMNPLGFGFDNFDTIGRWRTEVEVQDGSEGATQVFPIDASGTLVGTDIDGEFDGVEELIPRLAQSDQVAQCVARQWFRFALGRFEDAAADKRSLELVQAAAETGDIRELIVAITLTDAFRYRAVAVAANEGEPK